MKLEIEVRIKGPIASGKTYTLHKIQELLESEGFSLFDFTKEPGINGEEILRCQRIMESIQWPS